MGEKPKYRMGTGEKVFLWGFAFLLIIPAVAIPAWLRQRDRAKIKAEALDLKLAAIPPQSIPAPQPAQQSVLLWDGPKEGFGNFNTRDYPNETKQFGPDLARYIGKEVLITDSIKGAFEGKGANNTLLTFRPSGPDGSEPDPSVLALVTERNGIKFFKLGTGFLPNICFVNTISSEDGIQQILIADYDQGSGGRSGNFSTISLQNQSLKMVSSQFAEFSAMASINKTPKIYTNGASVTFDYFRKNSSGNWEMMK